MKAFTLFKQLVLVIPLFFPIYASGEDLPIMMRASNGASPPVLPDTFVTIGHWDVDDFSGNGGGGVGFPVKFDGDIHVGSKGTCGESGHYMISLGIDKNTLGKVKKLTLTASSKKRNIYDLVGFSERDKTKNCALFNNASRAEYLVGVWDVDGGGGYGNNGTSGDYFMVLTAELGDGNSGRKLKDLILIASNKKSATLRAGYELVGYWDVDKGGSKGTDGSTGKYMMTLLAKWGR